jgi:hypothetical protein
MFIKYEIERTTPDKGDLIRALGNRDRRIVSKSEWLKLEKDGFSIIRKHYFLFSSLSDWWLPLNVTNKITIIIAIGTATLTVILAIIFS